MGFTKDQFEKIADYALDVSKVLLGAVLVAICIPEKLVEISLASSFAGVSFSVLLFAVGLKLTHKKL